MAKREIYRGSAKIITIGAEEMAERQKLRLPEKDKNTAFFLVYHVKTDGGAEYDVKLEISHRELTGRALEWNKREDGQTPTQLDMTIKDLVRQGILRRGATEGELGGAMADSLIGKEVTISVSEDEKADGGYWPPRARFVSPFARLGGADASARMMAFVTGRPAPVEMPPQMPPPDAEIIDGDVDDMPF